MTESRQAALETLLADSSPADRRLYYGDDGQEAFWANVRTSPAYELPVREIREEGERLRREPTPELTYGLFSIYARRGTRLEYESVYFERRRRLNTFALLALLEPEEPAWSEALCDAIWTVCNEYTWCLPAHVKGSSADIRATIDLFAAETGFTLSEIGLLLEDRLPALLRERIAEETEARLFRPYLTMGPHSWESARHNWSAVCAGSIGSAALLSVREPGRLAEIVRKALGSIECFLSGYGEDGACLEGLGYWNYGFGYFVYFADLLKKRTDGAIDLFRSEKVRTIAAFQQKAYLDGDRTVNFSDSVPQARVHIGLAHYLRSVYGEEVELPPLTLRAAYTDDPCSRWAPALRNLLWFDPRKGGEDWRASDYYLPDAQWLVSRHTTGSGRFGFAAKGGNNGEPHNHNDIGQFILLADGETFAADLGSGEYTQAYFGEGRYAYGCNGSQGHSVPIVDGRLQSEGAESAAVVLEASIGDGEDRLKLEMASAYRLSHLKSLVRSFVWRKTALPSLELTDEFRFERKPDGIVERIVTRIRPVLAEGEVLLRGTGGRSLAIRYDGANLTPRVESRSYRDHFGRDARWYAIDFTLAGTDLFQTVRLQFQFL
ncbi:heparinase II/III family protein [Cohnella thermotolerans]|uniref:heparinase II/III family protein n=1 Tax=Cohnella thermotolerans TaxID=329858 RepID=UPI000428CA7D|nr:heparinase II/III family protein [Cohnella thermotolerans]